MQPFQLLEAALQAFAAAAQGTVDGFRGGGKAALEDGEGEADGSGAFVVFERAGAVELFADILGYCLVELIFFGRQFVGDGVGHALGKKGRAVELEQFLLYHAAHEVGDIDVVYAVAELALETVAVEQRHEELEVFLFAVVGGGGHEEELAGQVGEELAEAVALGIARFAAEVAGRHLVGFVAYDEVPVAVAGLEFLLHFFVAGELVEAGDDEVGLEEPVAGAGGFELVVGEDFEGQLEAAVELVLPLFGEAAGTDDEAALEVAAGDQLLDEEAGHDGLAGARIVGEEEAQGRAGQHGLVDGGDLVGKGLDVGGVDGQQGVEEVGEADALGLGDEAEKGAVAIEAPGAGLLGDVDAGLVVAVEELVGDIAGGCFVGQLDGVFSVPLHVDHRDEAVCQDALDSGVGCEFFQFHSSDCFSWAYPGRTCG